jgi:Na+/H+ antiporter NhaD/arsenite permease-like protein
MIPKEESKSDEPIPRKSGGKYNSTFLLVCTRLPWKILPFALSMFIMVEGLVVTGWVKLAASK